MSERDGDAYLQERYGRRNAGKPRWVLPALIFALIGGGWLIWSANHYSKPEIRTQLISFTVDTPSQVTLRYSINLRTPNKSHRCILTASDYQANVVGQITDGLPTGQESVVRTIHIPTRSAAASAAITHCS
jgi:hypothetical protein